MKIEFDKNYLIDLRQAAKMLDQNVGFDQYLLYYCGYCSDSNHSISTFYSDVDDVYDHWSSTHAKYQNPMPFRFTVAPLVWCRYCDIISTYAGMKKHQAEQHSMKPFVIKNLIDRTKCGLCHTQCGADNALDTHFHKDHQVVFKANLFNPIALDGNTLNKLVNLKGHLKRKCKHCSKVFEVKSDFYRYHNEKHASLKAETDKYLDNKSIHLIAGCCEAKLDPAKLFEHFKEHNIPSKIRLKTFYWETKAVFGNGLVLNKHNLIGTIHDDSEGFENFIRKTLDGKW